jgi:hypothetical protein
MREATVISPLNCPGLSEGSSGPVLMRLPFAPTFSVALTVALSPSLSQAQYLTCRSRHGGAPRQSCWRPEGVLDRAVARL